MREYAHKTRHIDLVKSYHHVYDRLSTQLRSEVAVCACREWFKQIALLSEASSALRTRIAHNVQGDVFAPSEALSCGNVYAMHRGIVVINGIVRASRRIFGIPSIMYSHKLRSATNAVAFTYCEVLFIDGHTLRELAETHDAHTARRMKTWATFEALRIFMVTTLRRKKLYEAMAKNKAGCPTLKQIGRSCTFSKSMAEIFDVQGVKGGSAPRRKRTGTGGNAYTSATADSTAELTADSEQVSPTLTDRGEARSPVSVTRRRSRKKLGARQSFSHPRPQAAFPLDEASAVEALPFDVQTVPTTPNALRLAESWEQARRSPSPSP